MGTMTVLEARLAVDALGERGADAGLVLRTAGLSRASLEEIDNRPPQDAVMRLWEAAAGAARDRYFGLHVAEALPLGACDLVDYLFAASATVGESYKRYTQYRRLISDEAMDFVLEPRYARLRRFPGAGVLRSQYDEYLLVILLVRSRQASGKDWSPIQVSFRHAGNDDGGELGRVLRCPMFFSARDIEMQIPLEVLDCAHVHADSRLLAILMRYADSQLTASPARGDLICRARQAIARQMARALPTLGSTAAQLRMPDRTLQRLLAQTGVTHTSLLDDIRRELALKSIRDARLSMSEIAFLLHFSDTTGFYRAFKRWTEETPIEYRRHLFGLIRPATQTEREEQPAPGPT